MKASVELMPSFLSFFPFLPSLVLRPGDGGVPRSSGLGLRQPPHCPGPVLHQCRQGKQGMIYGRHSRADAYLLLYGDIRVDVKGRGEGQMTQGALPLCLSPFLSGGNNNVSHVEAAG